MTKAETTCCCMFCSCNGETDLNNSGNNVCDSCIKGAHASKPVSTPTQRTTLLSQLREGVEGLLFWSPAFQVNQEPVLNYTVSMTTDDAGKFVKLSEVLALIEKAGEE